MKIIVQASVKFIMSIELMKLFVADFNDPTCVYKRLIKMEGLVR